MALISYRNEREEGKSFFRAVDTEEGINLIVGQDDVLSFYITVKDTTENRQTIDGIRNVIGALSDVLDSKAAFEYRAKKEIEFAFADEMGYNIPNFAIENKFSYHPPKEGQPEIYELMRSEGKALAYLLDAAVPDGHEKLQAMTRLEEVIFWANAGIARA